MLSIEHLSVARHHQQVLSDINFSLTTGEIIAVLGPNGSGKTTLFDAITGTHPKNSLRITAGGLSCNGQALNTIRDRVKHNLFSLPQQLSLWPHLSALENIKLPLQFRSPTPRGFSLDTLMEMFQISALSHKRPAQLSGGERQRIALVRTLALCPDFMLLDEPTAALDLEHVEQLVTVLKQLKLQGKSTLMITHSPKLALNLADRFLYLEKGQQVFWGNRQDLAHSHHPRLSLFFQYN